MSESGYGSYILIINDEPFQVVYPDEGRIVNQAIDTDLTRKERWYKINGREIPEINILWYVKGLTPENLSNLDTGDQIRILKDYLHGQKTIKAIKNNKDSYITEAINDYDTAVSNIFLEQPDFNVSCRASVSFACRILKAKLREDNKPFEEGDSLTELAVKIAPADFSEIEDIIPWIQKNPESGETAFDDAVNAVRSSLALFVKLFPDEKDGKKNRAFMNVAP